MLALALTLLATSALHTTHPRRLARPRKAAVAEPERKNVTLLTCAEAPDMFYLGDNATLFLRFLNATKRMSAHAVVTPEVLAFDAAGARVAELWGAKRLVVHDKTLCVGGVVGRRFPRRASRRP